jgi:acetylornithine deacetylase
MSYRAKNVLDSVESLRKDLFQFVQTIVRTPSLPGEEQAVQSIISKKLKDIELEADVVVSNFDELKDHPAFCDDGVPFHDRINVVGRVKAPEENTSSPQGSSLILNGHVDVVSPGNQNFWSESPWSGTITDGRLYGRGACDMKAGLASAIFAIQALGELGLRPLNEVLVESVIGEESGGVGTLTTITKGYRARAAIILEPTKLRLCPIQSGALTFRITVRGRAVHACMKNIGVSAIEKFYLILGGLDRFADLRHSRYRSNYYDDPTNVAPLNFGTIRGGNWHSTVPEELVVEGRYGVFPGEPIQEAKKSFTRALDEITQEDAWLRDHPPTLEWFEGQFESGMTQLDSPIVGCLKNTNQRSMGSLMAPT